MAAATPSASIRYDGSNIWLPQLTHPRNCSPVATFSADIHGRAAPMWFIARHALSPGTWPGHVERRVGTYAPAVDHGLGTPASTDRNCATISHAECRAGESFADTPPSRSRQASAQRAASPRGLASSRPTFTGSPHMRRDHERTVSPLPKVPATSSTNTPRCVMATAAAR